MLFITHYTDGNTDWCVVVVGKGGSGPLVDLPFCTLFINYPFNLKGNSKADPAGKSDSSASNSEIFSLTHVLFQCAWGGGVEGVLSQIYFRILEAL